MTNQNTNSYRGANLLFVEPPQSKFQIIKFFKYISRKKSCIQNGGTISPSISLFLIFTQIEPSSFTTLLHSAKTLTHGITPGGGDGYYISSKGYGTANIERAAYLYLGENARKRRQADRERAKAKSKLRRL